MPYSTAGIAASVHQHYVVAKKVLEMNITRFSDCRRRSYHNLHLHHHLYLLHSHLHLRPHLGKPERYGPFCRNDSTPYRHRHRPLHRTLLLRHPGNPGTVAIESRLTVLKTTRSTHDMALLTTFVARFGLSLHGAFTRDVTFRATCDHHAIARDGQSESRFRETDGETHSYN